MARLTPHKPESRERPLFWVANAKKDYCAFPDSVIDDMGYALGVVQFGSMPRSAALWNREGPGIFELKEEHNGNAYRVVFAVRFAQAIYVLHAFQKKSPAGIRTSRQDIELIHQRLKTAQMDYEERYG